MDSAGLDVLSEPDCLRMLASVPVGRIVFTDRALPAIQPVNFVVHEGSVIIQTSARSRLAIAATESVVAFEVDEFTDGVAPTGWSVVAVGRATRVTDSAELARVRQLGLRPWVPGTKDCYLRIEIEVVSGRRLAA
ncbi:MAG: pyridoxamine 5'-phosphate oxidase family protein [Kibdelosporangium sp.]